MSLATGQWFAPKITSCNISSGLKMPITLAIVLDMPCFCCRSRTHSYAICPLATCIICEEVGHLARNCCAR